MKQLNELIADFWTDYAALLLLGAGLIGVVALIGLGVWAKRSRKPLRPIALAVSMNLALLLNAEGMWVIAIDQLKLPKIFAVLVFAVFEICFLTATSLAAEQYRRTTVYGPDGKIVTPGHPGAMLYIAALIAAISGIIVASNAVTGTEKLLRLAVPCVIFLMWWAALTAAGQRVRRGRFAYSPRRLAERWGWLIPDDDPDLVRMAADRQVRRMVVNHHRVSSGRWPRAWWRSRLLKDARTAGEPVVGDVVEQLARIQRVMDLLVPGEARPVLSVPAVTLPAQAVPAANGSAVPGSAANGSTVPGPVANGSAMPGSAANGSAVPGPVANGSSLAMAAPVSAMSGPANLAASTPAQGTVTAGGSALPSAAPASPAVSAVPGQAPADPAVPAVPGQVPASPAVPAVPGQVPANPAVVPAVQFVQPVETEVPGADPDLDGTPAGAGNGRSPEVPAPRRSGEDARVEAATAVPGAVTAVPAGATVMPAAVTAAPQAVPDVPAPAVPAWAATPTGARPAVSIPGSPWWRLAVQNLSRLLATESTPDELIEMSYLQVTELARTLAPRVPELGEGVVRAFVIDYVRELSGEHGEAAYPWRDLLPPPAVAPKGSPAWLAGLEALRSALEEELSQGEPIDVRELADVLAPSAPRLDDRTIRGFVTDYLQALGGQPGPGAAQEWQHLLPRPQGGRGASDEEILEVYGRQLDEILRTTGRLSRYRVQSLTGVKSRVQADRIKATVEERVAAPA